MKLYHYKPHERIDWIDNRYVHGITGRVKSNRALQVYIFLNGILHGENAVSHLRNGKGEKRLFYRFMDVSFT